MPFFLFDNPSRLISEEIKLCVSDDDIRALDMLNAEQKFAFDQILHKVSSDEPGLFFIDGPGGTGKTFLYRVLLAAIRSRNQIALATASSGVAAGILPGGRTAHSRFKIPLQIDENSVCGVTKQSCLAELFKQSKLIIWDEAPMMHRRAIELVDQMLRDVNNSSLPFGGKVVVLGGDFRQVLPVVPKGSEKDVINASLVHSHLWKYFTKIKLVQNMRARLDSTFSDFLLRVGDGQEPCDSSQRIILQNNMVLPFLDDVTSLPQLIDVVFPAVSLHPDRLRSIINRVILTPKNECVDQINKLLMDRFPGDVVKYYSFDEPIDHAGQNFTEDFFNTLVPNGIPPHELILKKNCPVMLLRNINSSEGLCNGTRLICKHFETNVIHAEVVGGDYSGKIVFLPRIPFIPLDTNSCPFAFKRRQFPIRPCFAMTINKAQGQTLDYVGLYLPEHVFSHGQLYVALSRARTSNSIKVLIKPNDSDILSLSRTKNVVYHEVLSLANSESDSMITSSSNI